MRWAGVDVGGKRKGFHLALIESGHGTPRLCLQAQITGDKAAEGVYKLLAEFGPKVVAVDSPRRAAPVGKTQRACEHALNAAIGCGIIGTRDAATIAVRPDDLYEWIQQGWALYKALNRQSSWTVIECFPTATWARLDRVRPRGVSREKWSDDILRRELEQPGRLGGLPPKCNQDVRDAIGAAYTAYLKGKGKTKTQSFACPSCAIVVPR